MRTFPSRIVRESDWRKLMKLVRECEASEKSGEERARRLRGRGDGSNATEASWSSGRC
jgi:hypothetical protein